MKLNKTNKSLEDSIVTNYLNFMSNKQLICNICDNCMENKSIDVLCYIGSIFIKKTIKLLNMILLEYKDNVDFGIPDILINLSYSDNINVQGINIFYKYIYQKILNFHLSKKYKKGYSLTIKKMNQININNYKIINNTEILDDSIEYLSSNASMTNWKEEYDNLNPFGILLKYNADIFSYKGIYDHKLTILSGYPNSILSSITNNFIAMYDYYQLILSEFTANTNDDIDNPDPFPTSTLSKIFNINDYKIVDNLYGTTNIMLPIYICKEHWALVKNFWTWHLTFINNAFEFDYYKKMDNIYFLALLESIKTIKKLNPDINSIRLFIYLMRTALQICIDNKYSHNISNDYEKYKNILTNSLDINVFTFNFIDYIVRLIQLILNGGLEPDELILDINNIFIKYIKYTLFVDITELIPDVQNEPIIENLIEK
jgi:hypothetical protein